MADAPAKKATVKSVKFVDELVLERPQGVYTGDKHKRSKSASEMNGGSVRHYDVKKHRRALSLQPYMRGDGKLTTEASHWTPKPLNEDGTYGSEAMKELSEEFGVLAAQIARGFEEGK